MTVHLLPTVNQSLAGETWSERKAGEAPAATKQPESDDAASVRGCQRPAEPTTVSDSRQATKSQLPHVIGRSHAVLDRERNFDNGTSVNVRRNRCDEVESRRRSDD